MPRKLCIVDGTHDQEIASVYLERITDVEPNEPLVQAGVPIGYRVRVSASLERKTKEGMLLGNGLIRTDYSLPSTAQRTVADAMKVAAEVAIALVSRWKKEWADYPPDKEKVA